MWSFLNIWSFVFKKKAQRKNSLNLQQTNWQTASVRYKYRIIQHCQTKTSTNSPSLDSFTFQRLSVTWSITALQLNSILTFHFAVFALLSNDISASSCAAFNNIHCTRLTLKHILHYSILLLLYAVYSVHIRANIITYNVIVILAFNCTCFSPLSFLFLSFMYICSVLWHEQSPLVNLCTIESILSHCITVWYGSCSISGWKTPQRNENFPTDHYYITLCTVPDL